jgi:ADP-ribosylglycohydrolase
VLRRHGLAFRTSDVAAAWLGLLPFLQTYTAERAAIRTLVQGRGTGAAATFRNPYREWIGAAIRGDVFGYVCPGDPAAAARLAYRDAALSHTGNGVYGEMWVAALVAAAFTAGTAREALDWSLAVVPPRSRLHAAVDQVRGYHDEGLSWRQTRDRIGASLGHYSWVHTVNNAAVLTAGLLYGAGDFSATIGLTVSGGWDTDSTGATAGSVAGILAGPDGIPAHWREPLHDRVRSAVFGYDGATITDLARRTVEVGRRAGLAR